MNDFPDDPKQGLNAYVAAEMRGELAARGLTLQDLADASGVNYFTLRRYLAAERHINIATLQAVAVAIDTTPAEIVRDAQVRMARHAELDKPLPNLAKGLPRAARTTNRKGSVEAAE